jgi:hypothetical protein
MNKIQFIIDLRLNPYREAISCSGSYHNGQGSSFANMICQTINQRINQLIISVCDLKAGGFAFQAYPHPAIEAKVAI